MAYRILVLEDDRVAALLLKRAFNSAAKRQSADLALDSSENGFDAINFVARSDLLNALPDVVVVDLDMPVMDGMTFLRSLRTSFDLQDVRAIVLTSSSELAIHEAAMRAGADRVFAKPDSFGGLVAIAEQILAEAAEDCEIRAMRLPPESASAPYSLTT